MGDKERQEQFLARAKEAEERAHRAADEFNKAAWLRIAAGYHELAGLVANSAATQTAACAPPHSVQTSSI